MWYSTAVGITFLTTIISIALSVPSFAQTSAGRINGSVHTERGQVVPGAIVIMSNKDGSVQRRTRTDAQGGFTFSGIPDGSYVLQGCAEEIGLTSSTNVELKPGADVTQDLKMESGFVRTAEPVCIMDSPPP